MGGAIIDLVAVAGLTLIIGGVVYLTYLRSGGVSFRQALFNWPVVIIAAVVALLFMV